MTSIAPTISNKPVPSRRLFLAAGSAAAVFGGLHQAAAAENSELKALISAHSVARQAFCDAIDVEQVAERTGEGVEAADALWQETNDAEIAAAIAMLSYPCRTIEEARIKAEYILSSALHGELNDSDLYMPLLRSFLA